MKDRAILLVEDNPRDEALTLRALKKHGVANAVTVARDGAEALEVLFGAGNGAAQDEPKLPALVVLDLNLPKVGGLDVLRQIRADARTKLLPVVILTSSDEEKDLLLGYKLGANSYVRKPVEFHEFASAVHQLGLYWVLLNESAPTEIGDGGARGA